MSLNLHRHQTAKSRLMPMRDRATPYIYRLSTPNSFRYFRLGKYEQ